MAHPPAKDAQHPAERIPSICIVDDEVDFLLILRRIFSRFYPAYSVHCCTSGQALFADLPQLSPKPQLILLDRHMPELDGHQVLLQLKKHVAYKRIPVVMMSIQASDIEINGCYAADANSFVFKPIDFYSLKDMIGRICHYWLTVNLAVTD